ncbi:helix-turn-helix domain-containing protein [Nocardia lasii]|uniref:Helix-turn-helix domain-containing protein n=1 Tax=Nocardia lasii TaxID=1616107 RepID=A0ABW1JR62_9NOCA
MSSGFVNWKDVKSKAKAADPRSAPERARGIQQARERHEAYLRGHQLAEMRRSAGLTQTQLAEVLGVSQARVSKIESGEASGIDTVRAYVAALGGSVEVIATVGSRSWRVA